MRVRVPPQRRRPSVPSCMLRGARVFVCGSKMDVATKGPSSRHIVADWSNPEVARKEKHDGALTLEVRAFGARAR